MSDHDILMADATAPPPRPPPSKPHKKKKSKKSKKRSSSSSSSSSSLTSNKRKSATPSTPTTPSTASSSSSAKEKKKRSLSRLLPPSSSPTPSSTTLPPPSAPPSGRMSVARGWELVRVDASYSVFVLQWALREVERKSSKVWREVKFWQLVAHTLCEAPELSMAVRPSIVPHAVRAVQHALDEADRETLMAALLDIFTTLRQRAMGTYQPSIAVQASLVSCCASLALPILRTLFDELVAAAKLRAVRPAAPSLPSAKHAGNVYAVLLAALELFQQLQLAHPNRRQTFELFVGELLEPVMRIWSCCSAILRFLGKPTQRQAASASAAAAAAAAATASPNEAFFTPTSTRSDSSSASTPPLLSAAQIEALSAIAESVLFSALFDDEHLPQYASCLDLASMRKQRAPKKSKKRRKKRKKDEDDEDDDVEMDGPAVDMTSYHRALFDKLEALCATVPTSDSPVKGKRRKRKRKQSTAQAEGTAHELQRALALVFRGFVSRSVLGNTEDGDDLSAEAQLQRRRKRELSRSAVCFAMLQRLSDILGKLDAPLQGKSDTPEQLCARSFAVAEMLDTVDSHGIYRSNRDPERSRFNVLERLVLAALARLDAHEHVDARSVPALCTVVQAGLQLNHELVQPLLDQVWRMSWWLHSDEHSTAVATLAQAAASQPMGELFACARASDLDPPPTPAKALQHAALDEAQQLCSAIADTYVRLRQWRVVITSYATALRAAGKDAFPALSLERSLPSLSTHLRALPTTQAASLWLLHLKHLVELLATKQPGTIAALSRTLSGCMRGTVILEVNASQLEQAATRIAAEFLRPALDPASGVPLEVTLDLAHATHGALDVCAAWTQDAHASTWKPVPSYFEICGDDSLSLFDLHARVEASSNASDELYHALAQCMVQRLYKLHASLQGTIFLSNQETQAHAEQEAQRLVQVLTTPLSSVLSSSSSSDLPVRTLQRWELTLSNLECISTHASAETCRLLIDTVLHSLPNSSDQLSAAQPQSPSLLSPRSANAALSKSAQQAGELCFLRAEFYEVPTIRAQFTSVALQHFRTHLEAALAPGDAATAVLQVTDDVISGSTISLSALAKQLAATGELGSVLRIGTGRRGASSPVRKRGLSALASLLRLCCALPEGYLATGSDEEQVLWLVLVALDRVLTQIGPFAASDASTEVHSSVASSSSVPLSPTQAEPSYATWVVVVQALVHCKRLLAQLLGRSSGSPKLSSTRLQLLNSAAYRESLYLPAPRLRYLAMCSSSPYIAQHIHRLVAASNEVTAAALGCMVEKQAVLLDPMVALMRASFDVVEQQLTHVLSAMSDDVVGVSHAVSLMSAADTLVVVVGKLVRSVGVVVDANAESGPSNILADESVEDGAASMFRIYPEWLDFFQQLETWLVSRWMSAVSSESMGSASWPLRAVGVQLASHLITFRHHLRSPAVIAPKKHAFRVAQEGDASGTILQHLGSFTKTAAYLVTLTPESFAALCSNDAPSAPKVVSSKRILPGSSGPSSPASAAPTVMPSFASSRFLTVPNPNAQTLSALQAPGFSLLRAIASTQRAFVPHPIQGEGLSLFLSLLLHAHASAPTTGVQVTVEGIMKELASKASSSQLSAILSVAIEELHPVASRSRRLIAAAALVKMCVSAVHGFTRRKLLASRLVEVCARLSRILVFIGLQLSNAPAIASASVAADAAQRARPSLGQVQQDQQTQYRGLPALPAEPRPAAVAVELSTLLESMASLLTVILSKHSSIRMVESTVALVLESCSSLTEAILARFCSSVAPFATVMLRLLLAAFKHRTDAVVQHMPVFLRTTRSLMVCVLSRVDAAGSSAVHQLSRLLAALGDPLHRKLVNKYSPYLLYDYVWVTLVKPLPSAAETVIQAGVWQLMTACSDYEFQQVFASLPSIGKAAFKELHASFTRQFKYTGA